MPSSAAGSINSGRHILLFLAFTMRRALRKRSVFDFVPGYLKGTRRSLLLGVLHSLYGVTLSTYSQCLSLKLECLCTSFKFKKILIIHLCTIEPNFSQWHLDFRMMKGVVGDEIERSSSHSIQANVRLVAVLHGFWKCRKTLKEEANFVKSQNGAIFPSGVIIGGKIRTPRKSHVVQARLRQRVRCFSLHRSLSR